MQTKHTDIGFIILILLAFAAGVFSWQLYFKDTRQKDTVDIHRFPDEIDGWKAKELPISDEEYAILETRNAFARKYTDPDGRIAYLLLVYSQDNRKVSHPPEICYTGGGLTVIDKERLSLGVPAPGSGEEIAANRMVVEQGGSKQVSYYLFKIGDSFTPSYWKQQVLIALKSITGKSASSALIRISSPIQEEGGEGADEDVKDFAVKAIPLIMQYLP